MIHLHPTASLADRVLLPGDPGRALLLAQSLLEAPKMFNHNRGLWGYTGAASDGRPLTIQSTGMGGPSAAIVISELAAAAAVWRAAPGPNCKDVLAANRAALARCHRLMGQPDDAADVGKNLKAGDAPAFKADSSDAK